MSDFAMTWAYNLGFNDSKQACFVALRTFAGLTRFQIDILDGYVPMSVQDLESSLLLALVGFLVGKQLSQGLALAGPTSTLFVRALAPAKGPQGIGPSHRAALRHV
jgi:hypothetical protein